MTDRFMAHTSLCERAHKRLCPLTPSTIILGKELCRLLEHGICDLASIEPLKDLGFHCDGGSKGLVTCVVAGAVPSKPVEARMRCFVGAGWAES